MTQHPPVRHKVFNWCCHFAYGDAAMWLKCVRHPKNAIFMQNFAMSATPESITIRKLPIPCMITMNYSFIVTQMWSCLLKLVNLLWKCIQFQLCCPAFFFLNFIHNKYITMATLTHSILLMQSLSQSTQSLLMYHDGLKISQCQTVLQQHKWTSILYSPV